MKTLRVMQAYEYESSPIFNPLRLNNERAALLALLFNAGICFEREGCFEWVYGRAERMEEGARDWKVTLKPSKYSDGSPLTIEDFKASLLIQIEEGHGIHLKIDEFIDPLSIKIDPDSAALFLKTRDVHIDLSRVLAKRETSILPKEFNCNPSYSVTTGPYYLSRKTKYEALLLRNEYFPNHKNSIESIRLVSEFGPSLKALDFDIWYPREKPNKKTMELIAQDFAELKDLSQNYILRVSEKSRALNEDDAKSLWNIFSNMNLPYGTERLERIFSGLGSLNLPKQIEQKVFEKSFSLSIFDEHISKDILARVKKYLPNVMVHTEKNFDAFIENLDKFDAAIVWNDFSEKNPFDSIMVSTVPKAPILPKAKEIRCQLVEKGKASFLNEDAERIEKILMDFGLVVPILEKPTYYYARKTIRNAVERMVPHCYWTFPMP